MTKQREPWFEPKRTGYGLTPTTWQGWCLTFIFLAVLLGSVRAVLYLVRDPANAVIVILLVTATECAVFIPFTYRHARRPGEEADQSQPEDSSMAEVREKAKRDLEEWKKRNIF